MAVDDSAGFQGHRRRVLVAVSYAPMRRMLTEFLEREDDCWSATSATVADLAEAIERTDPDAIIVGAADFPRCCRVEFGGFPAGRVVVIGHESDPAYRAAALRSGAGAWVAAAAVGDELIGQMHAVVARDHDINTDD